MSLDAVRTNEQRWRVERTRNSTWLSAATDRKITRLAARCIEEMGRMPGRNGGWRGKVIDAALALVDEEALLATLRAEIDQRKQAA
jgi:membrane-bound ClpP family serine protease